MPISSTQRKVGPTPGNGTSRDFPFAFKVFDPSQVEVIRTSANGGDVALTQPTDYIVTLNPDQNAQPGGTVRLSTALGVGLSLTILSAVPITQLSNWQSQGGFNPDDLDDDLDRQTAVSQQLAERLARTLAVPATVADEPIQMAKPVGDALLAWSADGTRVVNVDPASLASHAAYSSSELDVFTGDGVETVFNLSLDGGSLANLRVSIAGVAQTPGEDFQWNGGTEVEFAEPPADGLKIVVQYFAVMASSSELNDAAARSELARDEAEAAAAAAVAASINKANRDGSNALPAFITAIGADESKNIHQPNTAAQAQAAPALSLARAGRQVVDVLRRVPDLAFARAGLLDIAPYVQAEMNDWGAAEYVLDRGLFQWNSRVDVPSGAEFRTASREAKLRPGPGLGAASAAGAAIRLTLPNSGVRGLRFDGSQMGEAACVLLDVGANPINDTFCIGCEADNVAAFWWDRGTGDGTAGVGRHYLTNVQGNTVRRSRGVAFRCYYGFGFLNFNRNNTVDRNGSSAPNNLAFDASGAALSALLAAGGLFVDVVVLGTASAGATAGQQSFRFKSLTEITLQEGTSSDGAGGVAYEFDACRLVRPQYIIAAFGNDHAVIFRNVETVDGGRFEIRGRQGLPGAVANKDAVRLEGANANFEIERIKSDGATGNALNRLLTGNSLIHVERLAGRNGGRRMLQLSGGGGSFTCTFASSVNNNLTGVDATANYETTSAADKIANFQLPSGGVTAVTAPGAG